MNRRAAIKTGFVGLVCALTGGLQWEREVLKRSGGAWVFIPLRCLKSGELFVDGKDQLLDDWWIATNDPRKNDQGVWFVECMNLNDVAAAAGGRLDKPKLLKGLGYGGSVLG